MLPIAVMEYCNPIGIPMVIHVSIFLPFNFISLRLSFNISNFLFISIRHNIPLTACDVMVAPAAPAHPHLNTIMNSRSNSMLETVETARNIKGVLESPTARSIPARILYRSENGIPSTIIRK